jgi:fibronectin-binding autotransporter adhesin
MKNALTFKLMAALPVWLCLASGAQAQSAYVNSATGNWSAAGSWTGTPPSAGGAVDATVSIYNDDQAPIVANNNLAGAFMLNQLSDDIATSPSYPSASAAMVYVNAATGSSLLFTNFPDGSAPKIITSGIAGLDISSPITLANNLSIVPYSGSTIILDGPISETAPSSISLDGYGGTTTVLSTNNTYSGGTTVNYGSVRPRANRCFGTGLLTWASTGVMFGDRNITLANDIQVGGGYPGVNLQIYMSTNDSTLQLLGKIYNQTPAEGGSVSHHLNLFGPLGTIVVSNAAYLGNFSLFSNLKACNVAGSFNNWGGTGVGGSYADTNTVLNVLSNATLAGTYDTSGSAGLSCYGKMNVYGTYSLGGANGATLIWRTGVVNVKPGGYWTNTYNTDVYGTMNVEAGGTADCGGSISSAGTNTSMGIVGVLNVYGTVRSRYVAVGFPGAGQYGAILNVYSNGVVIARSNFQMTDDGKASIAGSLSTTALSATGPGSLRLSDGTNAGTAQIGNFYGTGGIIRITGGAPGMSSLIIANTDTNADTNFVLGGAGVNDNNLQLTKQSSGILSLNNSAYKGDTKVLGGTLALGSPNLATNSTITVSNAVLELNFAATNTVTALVVNGTNAVAGVHSATTDPGILAGVGSLRVLTSGASYSTTPTNLTYSVSGGGSTLNLSWPASYLGWYVQSNAVAVANTNYWFDVPNSQNGTSLAVPLNGSKTNVFYRMRRPN